MKISILSTTTFPSPPQGYGGEVVIFDLAKALSELNHEVILYCVKNNNTDYGNIKVNPLRNTYVQADGQAEFEAKIYYEDDLLSSDVILDMSHMKSVASYYNNLKIEAPPICSYLIGNVWCNPFPSYNIIVNSNAQLQMGIKGETGFEGTPFEFQHGHNGSIPETSKYIHLGVNTGFYKFQEKKEDYFLWMGRFHPWKGTGIAIQLAKDTGINLVLTGGLSDSPDHIHWGKEYLKQIVDYDNIKYVPLPQDNTHQTIKKELIQNAKGFLNPIQFHESFGLVNVEALSCGTPVISMAMGALPEIIKHGETGFLCKNYEEFKNYVKVIDEINPKDCRKDVMARFSREVMAKNYETLLLQLRDGLMW